MITTPSALKGDLVKRQRNKGNDIVDGTRGLLVAALTVLSTTDCAMAQSTGGGNQAFTHQIPSGGNQAFTHQIPGGGNQAFTHQIPGGGNQAFPQSVPSPDSPLFIPKIPNLKDPRFIDPRFREFPSMDGPISALEGNGVDPDTGGICIPLSQGEYDGNCV